MYPTDSLSVEKMLNPGGHSTFSLICVCVGVGSGGVWVCVRATELKIGA